MSRENLVLPDGWAIKKIKYIAKKIGSGKTPKGGSEVYTDQGVIFIRSQNVYDDGLRLADVVFISSDIDSQMSNTRVLIWDILLNITGASIGRTCIVDRYIGLANVNQHVCIIRIEDKTLAKYTAWTMKSDLVKSQIQLAQTGAAREGLNFEEIGKLDIHIPHSSIIQQKIVAFLDKETAKIDTLIEKQQRLIKLLQEKRQAVISHAVTKGLNPAVEMKDSGVEWLGEVPAHWVVLRNRRVIKTIEQGWSPQADNRPPSVDEWGVTKLSSVKQGQFHPQKSKTLYPDDDPSRGIIVKEGDFLITRANTPKLVGDVCVVPALQHKKLLLCDLIYRVTFSENVDPQYLCAFFLSNSGRTQVKVDARGASMSMAKISQSHIKDWLAPIPPIEEQVRIVDYLNSQTKKIDQTVDAAKRAIQLLKERRTALISAAVTGKIDVRDAV